MTTSPTLAALVAEGLEHALSYADFRERMAGSPDGTPLYADEYFEQYNRLNDQRMTRLDKTLELIDEARDVQLDRPLTLLVLTEGWCGDGAHVVPALNLLAEHIDNLELKTLFRDEHLALMDAFLTEGSRSIPKVIIVDSASHEVLDSWGPRPAPAQALFHAFRADPAADRDAFERELQQWYNRDRTVHTQREMLEVLQRHAG